MKNVSFESIHEPDKKSVGGGGGQKIFGVGRGNFFLLSLLLDAFLVLRLQQNMKEFKL